MIGMSGRGLRRLTLIAGSVVVVLAVGGVAYGVIPDAGTNVIHSCYDKTTGALRVIDPSKGQSCTASETALKWNGRGLNLRGGWNSTTSYAAGDVVTLGGGTYAARLANSNSMPPNSNWATLGSPSYANVFSESNQSNPGTYPVIISSNLTNVGQTTGVPAGNYTVSAQVLVFMDNGAQDVQCYLTDNHGNFANGYAETSGPPDSGSTGVVQTLALTDAFTTEPVGTHFAIQCATANGADLNTSEVVSASLSANLVGHVVFNGTSFATP